MRVLEILVKNYRNKVLVNKLYVQFLIGFHSNVNTQIRVLKHNLLIKNILFLIHILYDIQRPLKIFSVLRFPQKLSAAAAAAAVVLSQIGFEFGSCSSSVQLSIVCKKPSYIALNTARFLM